MKQHLEILTQALNKATKLGAFTLDEASLVSNSLKVVNNYIRTQMNDNAINNELLKVSEEKDRGEGFKETPKN